MPLPDTEEVTRKNAEAPEPTESPKALELPTPKRTPSPPAAGSGRGDHEAEAHGKHCDPQRNRCSYRVHIVSHTQKVGDSFYLLRLRKECNHECTYLLKRFSDFERLLRDLELQKQNRSWGELSDITLVPEMPKTGRFGFRRALSKVGLSDFGERQRQSIQDAIDLLMSQVPSLYADPTLSAFFTPPKNDPGYFRQIEEMLLQMRSNLTMKDIEGYWRLAKSNKTWTINASGVAKLDGRHRGSLYDFREKGEGAKRTIYRDDGWTVDLDRSTKDQLIWTLPGKLELQWHRVDNTEAVKALQKIADLKATFRQIKPQVPTAPTSKRPDGKVMWQAASPETPDVASTVAATSVANSDVSAAVADQASAEAPVAVAVPADEGKEC